MPKTLCMLIALVALILGMSAGSQAQLEPKALLKVDIPFDFIVGGMHLPAGHYTLLHAGGPNNIMLRNADGHGQALVRVRVTNVNPEEARTKLLFTKYGDKIFLSQVWTDSDNQMHQCFKCNEELTLEAQQKKPETVGVQAQP